MVNRRLSLLLLVVAAALLPGCGTKRPETIPVTGTVTFAGGPPPAAGNLTFAPLEAAPGYALRPAFGTFDDQGHVTVTSFRTADGLVPGRYEVKVECWRVPPTEEAPGESYVPEAYVPTEVRIEPNSKAFELMLDIPAPPP